MAIDDPLIEKDQLLVGGKGLVPQIFAAFLAGVMVLANSIAYRGIVASCGFLTDAFGALVQQAIIWQAIGSFLMKKSNYLTIAVIDPLCGSFFSQGTTLLARRLAPESDLFVPHAFLLMSLFTAMFGAVTYACTRAGAGLLLKFIPFTVTGGLVGGFGLIIVDASWTLALGTTPLEGLLATARGDALPALRTALLAAVTHAHAMEQL